MRDVLFLPFPPRRLWRLIRIGAAGHDRADFFPKFLLDLALPLRSATILHCVVQERSDRLGFIRAVLQRDRGDAQEMALIDA